jgi:hypothetical protein
MLVVMPVMCYVPASLAVIVIVIVVSGVLAGFTLVEVSVVRFV